MKQQHALEKIVSSSCLRYMSARGHFSSAVAAAVSPASTKTVIYVAEGSKKWNCAVGKCNLIKATTWVAPRIATFYAWGLFQSFFIAHPWPSIPPSLHPAPCVLRIKRKCDFLNVCIRSSGYPATSEVPRSPWLSAFAKWWVGSNGACSFCFLAVVIDSSTRLDFPGNAMLHCQLLSPIYYYFYFLI